jgi:hypothetical protein
MSDTLDHLISDAFTQFDDAERNSYLPTPAPGTVRRTVAHRRRVRYVSLSVLSAILIAVPVALIATIPHGNNSPPDVVASSSPTVSSAPTTTPTPTSTPTSTATPTPAPTATSPAWLINTTLTLPAFPGASDECGKAGSRKFVKGVAHVVVAARPYLDVTLTIGQMLPINTDLDGVAGNELLTTLHCSTGQSFDITQLLALRVGPSHRLSFLGYVIPSPDSHYPRFDNEDVRVEAGVVLVTIEGPYQGDGWPLCYNQVRGYAYRGGAFTQVSGPTSFPAPPRDIHKVDFRNAGLRIGIDDPGGGAYYCVAFVNGSGIGKVYPNNDETLGSKRYTFTIGPVSFMTDRSVGDRAAAIVTYRSTDGETIQSVQLFRLDAGVILGDPVQVTGADGVTSIEQVRVSGTDLIVTLTADGKSQVWTYRHNEDSDQWEHVG